jgi:cyclopropane-fatty-acyl-phospholipid synthase
MNAPRIPVRNESGASPEAIRHHYDVGNEFYALWLDPSMSYSSALWLIENEGLDAAQLNKLDWHIDRCGIETGSHLLDVGCGWGGLMRRVAQRYPQSSCCGLTLSQAQADYINEHRDTRIEVRLENWMDHQSERAYDAIVSVGAFEHFARLDQSTESKIDSYRRFFEFCSRNLAPKGRMSLQTITYEKSDRANFSEFFANEIFPESDLPHLEQIILAAKGVFEIVELRNDRHHYANTLRQWRIRLQNKKKEAISLVGEDRFNTYEKYLSLMIIAFHSGSMNLCRLAMQRFA